MTETRANWLRARVDCTDDCCLIWPFSRNRGYGNLQFEGKIRYAHRVMCELVHGLPPSPLHEAAHSCGNGREGCVNPKHLSWKTRADNQADSVAMGRCYRSGRAGPLNAEMARQIKALKGHASLNDLASRFGVTYSTIAKIHRGELWRDVA